MSHHSDLVLTGLDGSNPLGFLAAVGLLRVLCDADPSRDRSPHLSWRDEGVWRPALTSRFELDEIVDVVVNDAATWREEPAFRLAYMKSGQQVLPEEEGAIWDVKPPPAILHDHLGDLAASAQAGQRRSADMAAALGSEDGLDRSGFIKPTGFHFTAGQQQFLRMITGLAVGLEREHVFRALTGPWKRDSQLPTFAWDSMESRMYALRASDPSSVKRGGEPGADWLAIQALPAFPVFAQHGKAVTRCFTGGWRDAVFTWPLWTPRATYAAVRSLLAVGHFAETPVAERRARGIALVFRSSVTRSDQGGYGNFTPAVVA